jgi:synaptojanin
LHYRYECIPQFDIWRRSNVIWLADTNYRIDLDNASVRAYAEDDALDMLLAADQLSYVMSTGVAFSGYIEGPILFRPTYRYDVGTDNYDTSEKMRIPAWTGSPPFPLFLCKHITYPLGT